MLSLLRICKNLPKFTPLYGQRVQALAAAASKNNTAPAANETDTQPRYFRGKKVCLYILSVKIITIFIIVSWVSLHSYDMLFHHSFILLVAH